MKKRNTPSLDVSAKPATLKFAPPQRALDTWMSMAQGKRETKNDEIEILGVVGEDFFSEGVTAKQVNARLKSLKGDPVTVVINSPGGDAFEGIAIYNLLREYDGAVNVSVIGMAASAASVIAMAGDTVRMSEGSMLMIHSAWGAVVGNRQDLESMASVLEAIDNNVAGLYASRTGIAKDAILEMMEAETWMSAEEAIDKGFGDIVSSGSKSPSKRAAKGANASALASLAASGRQSAAVQMSANRNPGVTGKKSVSLKGDVMKKTIAEQISAFEAKRMALADRSAEIMDLAEQEGRSLEEAEIEEHDGLLAEIKTVDDHIVRLKDHEKLMLSRAKPVDDGQQTQNVRQAGKPTTGIVSVGNNLPKGIAFTRYVKALAVNHGNVPAALMMAQSKKDWKDTTPEVEKVLMAAVAGGDTTTAGWASELVYSQNLVADFIELLRPATIIGRIQGLRNVPFNVRMGGQTAGSTGYWVGQGAPVPVSKLTTTDLTLGIAKAAGLVVLTEELVRSSSPSAEMLVRDDLRDSIAEFLDVQFVDPNYAEVANVSPASITNGVTAVTPTGTSAATLRADIQTLFNTWIQNNLNPAGGVWIMSSVRALAISLMRTSLDQPEFPGITMNGGTFFGLPVITSQSANIAGSPDSGDMIILANAPEILLADEGGVTIDASREAAIQMLDNPTNNAASGTATTMVSMFQTNSVAIKATRFINWKKRRSTAVQFIQNGAYVA